MSKLTPNEIIDAVIDWTWGESRILLNLLTSNEIIFQIQEYYSEFVDKVIKILLAEDPDLSIISNVLYDLEAIDCEDYEEK